MSTTADETIRMKMMDSKKCLWLDKQLLIGCCTEKWVENLIYSYTKFDQIYQTINSKNNNGKEEQPSIDIHEENEIQDINVNTDDKAKEENESTLK